MSDAWLSNPTRYYFFTGKGGVGKTTLSTAFAVQLADAGQRVLIVSTDPASNLDAVLGCSLSSVPTAVPEVANLSAANLDPEQAAAAYRERLIGPYRNVLPESAVTAMEEQFSGSCTIEIAAFNEFAQLLGDRSATADFDVVLFDTAPTGHTLRLLSLPSAWSGFLDDNTTGTSCLGPLAGLQQQRELYEQTLQTLKDPLLTSVVLVTRPEEAALREAARSSHELKELGVENQQLIINGTFTATDANDPYAVAWQAQSEAALADMPAALNDLPQRRVPLASRNLMGPALLRSIRWNGEPAELPAVSFSTPASEMEPQSLSTLVDRLAEPGHGVIMTMGKGGVGKTTLAAAIAVRLAEAGYPVELSTTDPAAHLADALADADSLSNLKITRIDPKAEVAAYTAEVLATSGKNLDAAGRALLEEDLRSPCTEEIAVFRAFAKAVASAEERYVVLDTAPTGHTILLLDSALSYHRDVKRLAQQIPASVESLLKRLRDSEYTRLLIATLPETTPIQEARQLQADLQRADIQPFAWIVNQSLTPLSLTDPFLKLRQQAEAERLTEVAEASGGIFSLVPWQIAAPVGVEKLLQLSEPHTTHESVS
ncbi:arsenical pump-driving ATPase [Rubinisphaera brasiliensis]|uniref:arsenite-transporting ATPase n=1 Tax=Rubinisphaera brasiliensis (strain ATCC 49424 / DSM 5305 / JCM 21570 / IAM 15109 / NBRC 103401 / IFAM 1448) TaxID=756272 RepID=F0SJU4_RUBBR|nr:arsenical pump-driving ATPase [Rubinisphaera brasiliensis]ADY58633.1 arsenite efflux ATP-binding protein ArsA [Rubinisphaera brasiliensis DSM 5305]